MRSVVGVLGELLITAGLVVGLFAVYTLFWTGVETSREQDVLEREFEAQSQPESSSTPDASGAEELPSDAYARMRIPRLGESWEWIVVEGVDLNTLTRGPGHYPESAAPGETGNFAVAGHRATYGEPFAYLDQVQAGDEILVERDGQDFRYVVTESFITVPSDTDVLLPVPGQPGVDPEIGTVTLTTCNPRWGSTQRLIVHGALQGSEPVTAQASSTGATDGESTT